MKIICFSGNLGNQVFYCAFKDYIETKMPQESVYRFVMRGCPSVSVNRCFNLSLPKQSILVDIISFFLVYFNIFLKKVFHIALPNSIVCSGNQIDLGAFIFSNYLQDKFFYEERDSSWLQIKMPPEVSDDYKIIERLILETNSISVHVRRGDYINPGSSYEDLSATDYYDIAIALAKKKYPDGKLFVFSDDLDYVRNRFGKDAYYVDCNRGDNSYLDMKLMSISKVNIMANSTFSYWAAYMGHEHKLVICPKKWFRSSTGRAAPTIMLESWIRV